MKLSKEFNVKILGWLYATPTAFQITAHLFEGFIVPGILGIIFKYWQEITRSIWEGIFTFLPFDTQGVEPMFDILSLGIIVLFTVISVKIRKQPGARFDLKSEFSDADFFRKRLITLRTAVIIHTFIIIFSVSGVLLKFTSKSSGVNIYGVFLFYVVSLVYILMSVEYYFGFPYEKIAEKIECDRVARNISWGTIFTIPGLLLYAGILGMIFIVLYTRNFVVFPDMVRILILKCYALAFFLLWLSHFWLNCPRTSGIVGNSRLVINGILILGVAMIPFGPFAWESYNLIGNESKPLMGILMVFGSAFATLSFVLLMKISWKIPLNIFLIVCVFVVVDKIINLLSSSIPGVS